MKLTKLQIFVIIMGLLVIGVHAAPIAEAHPLTGPVIKEGIKYLKDFVKAITKIYKSGEINAAHKSLEKAFQKLKEHPVAYGLAAAEVVDIAKEGVVTITEMVDSKTYKVKLEINDDDQCLNIYVNDERVGVLAYNQLNNLEEDEVNTIIKNAGDNAIIEYQIRHKSGT